MLPAPEAQLSRMSNEIGDLVQHIDQHRALTSPIRRIPQEILQEIFIHCLPTDHNAIMSAHEAPLMLGRICSSWRSISISMPRLWTTVHVPIPDGYHNFEWFSEEMALADSLVAATHIADLRTAALKEWLNRSKSLPVNISFTQWGDSSPPSVPAPQSHHSYPIVDTILSVAHRWREISIAAPAQTMMRFLTHPPHELPFLESLDFDFTLGHLSHPIAEILLQDHNIYQTPSLRKLCLMQLPGNCLQLPVSWARLTDLTVERKRRMGWGLPLPQAVELLSRCPRLVRCRLEIRLAATTPDQFPLITLPDLESLTILERTDVTSMFNCLDLPVLREVEYHGAMVPAFPRRSSLLTLLKKSNGLIRKFATDPQTFTRTDLIECLRLIPNVTTLIFKRSPDIVGQDLMATILDKEFLYSFLPSASGRKTICPQLINLQIDIRLPSLSDEDLLRFLLQKQGASSSEILAPLKRLWISWKMEIVPVLARLVAEGLDLRLGYPPRPSKVLFSPLDGLRVPNDI